MPLHFHSSFNLTLVRHGETDLNLQGLLQGQALNVDLNDTGQNQATLLGNDLIRTKTTCQLILNENDDFKGKQDEVVYDQLLRERAFGEYDGKAWHKFKEAAKASGLSTDAFNPEGGESSQAVEERGVTFFEKLCMFCHNHQERLLKNEKVQPLNILVVSHGGYLHSLNVSFSKFYHGHFSGQRLYIAPNTGRSRYEVTLSNKYLPGNKDKVVVPSAGNSDRELSTSKGVTITCNLLNDNTHLQ